MDIAKMKLPKLRMCCFCVPLRSGFLTWGYVNLIYHVVVFGFIIAVDLVTLLLAGMAQETPSIEITVLLPIVVICIITQSLLVVVAGHTDNIRMLKGLFIAGAVLWIFEVLYYPCLAARMMLDQYSYDTFVYFLATVVVEPVLQTYGLLLIRSMVLKLQEERPEHHNVEYVNINKNETGSRDPKHLHNV